MNNHHQQDKNIRVRFAPSPTGHLHIGGVRTAIFNWLFARHTGGTYLLRIEDTDTQRSTKEFLASQLKSLEWFGLMPDEPIVYQLARSAEHLKAAQQLIEKKLVYPCFCEPRDTEEVAQELAQGFASKYPGTCRDKPYTPEDLAKPHALRFKVPHDCQEVTFTDLIRGDIKVTAEHMDDFVIIRRDKTPTYNFCVVVDDIFMKISHIIRGEDHIPNTTKQVLMYQALGAKPPLFAHLPLILGPSGAKLSKRDAATSVENYRHDGFLPEALFNYLVRLGWSHGDQELFTREEIVKYFSLDAISKKGAIFDIKKLEWVNGVYLRQASTEKLMRDIGQMDDTMPSQLQQQWDSASLERLFELFKQRAHTLRQLCNDILAFAHDPQQFDASLITAWKQDQTKQLVSSFAEWLKSSTRLQHQEMLDKAKELCTASNQKLVALGQPLRLALTGSVQSPSVFELIEILGKERTQERLKVLLQQF